MEQDKEENVSVKDTNNKIPSFGSSKYKEKEKVCLEIKYKDGRMEVIQ